MTNQAIWFVIFLLILCKLILWQVYENNKIFKNKFRKINYKNEKLKTTYLLIDKNFKAYKISIYNIKFKMYKCYANLYYAN